MSLTALAQQETGAANAPSTAGDEFKQMLAYVPTEMVTLYVSLTALISASAVSDKYPWMFGISIVCLVGSAVWVIVANLQSTTKAPPMALYYRVVAAILAFAAWAYILGYAIRPAFKAMPEYSLTASLIAVIVPFALSYVGKAVNWKAPPRSESVRYLPDLSSIGRKRKAGALGSH